MNTLVLRQLFNSNLLEIISSHQNLFFAYYPDNVSIDSHNRLISSTSIKCLTYLTVKGATGLFVAQTQFVLIPCNYALTQWTL